MDCGKHKERGDFLIVLGIDPGYALMGWGVVESSGGRMRLIVQDIEAVKPILPMPDLLTGVECWITAGGAHHTVLSYDVSAEMMRDWARMMDIEFVHISKDTTPEKLEEDLLVKDLIWKLRRWT